LNKNVQQKEKIMENNAELIWDNKEDQVAFEAAGFTSFGHFWNIEDNENVELQVRRQHLTDDGDVERQTVRVPFNGENYFLKRTSAASYQSIINEYKGAEYAAEFGLIPPQVAVHCFDDSSKRGFILFRNMNGFYCLDNIYQKKIPAEALEKIGDGKVYHPQIIEIFNKFQKSKYFYRDWMDKHIFINPTTDQIGLIDLERFLPKSEMPFHWRLPIIHYYKRKKEQKKLARALRIDTIK